MHDSGHPGAAPPFARQLRQARREASLTQAALAEQAGLSTRTIEHLEEGRGQPYPDTLQRLVDALGLQGEQRIRFELAGRRPLPADRGAPGLPRAPTGTLPLALTSFLGRQGEVHGIIERLRDPAVRLLTLTGPGGSGKTRLALEVAAELTGEFPDGVFFVPLAPIVRPELVPARIARTLGVREMGSRPVLDGLRDYLRKRALLLVLDNFEQILAAAPVVADLLSWCPGVKALVTSRAPLEVRGEHELAVAPLPLPDRGSPHTDDLLRYAAVALFVERASAVRPEFVLTEQNAPAVAEICRRLDGLPLAIELAAARGRLQTPEALLSRLERRLPVLVGGPRDLPTRQQTLRATFAWSYDLLDSSEQRFFRRLSVFVGGCTLAAVEAVCNAERDPDVEVADVVASLLAKSLLRHEHGHHDELRVGMLETVREYASEQLQAAGDTAQLRNRHLEYFLAFAEAADKELRGPRQAEWFDRLERDNDNLGAALHWSHAAQSDPSTGAPPGLTGAASPFEAGTRLADALEFFWVLRGHGRENLSDVLALATSAPPGTPARARALTVAAHIQGTMLGDYAAAAPLADEALGLWRALRDPHGTAVALIRCGIIASARGEHQRARALIDEASAHFRSVGGEHGLETPLTLIVADTARAAGDRQESLRLQEQALPELRAQGDAHGVAYAMREMAGQRRAQGRVDEAVALLHDSLARLAPLKDIRCAQLCLEELALGLAEYGPASDAARLFAMSEALRDLMGKSLPPAQAEIHQRGLDSVKQRLDTVSFDTVWADGRRTTLEQAIAWVLGRRWTVSHEQRSPRL